MKMPRPLVLVFTAALLLGSSAHAASPPEAPGRFSGGGQLRAASAQANGTLVLDARLRSARLAPASDQKQSRPPAAVAASAAATTRFTFAAALRDQDAEAAGAIACGIGNDIFQNGFE